MNNFDPQFKKLYQNILLNGEKKVDRTGVGTLSLFNPPQIRVNLQEGFPLLTLRKIHIKSIIHELLWFLGSYDQKWFKFGKTNIRYLLDNNVTFWTEWCYKDFLTNSNQTISQKEFEILIQTDDDFALKWGDLGPVYPKQWQSFNGKFNQIDDIINQLKTNPDSRRILVSAWNPEDMKIAKLPCCHMMFQFYTNVIPLQDRIKLLIDKKGTNYLLDFNDNERWEDYLIKSLTENNIPERKISLMLYMRSNDTYLGLPYNVAEYSVLLHMISQVVNMIPNEFILNVGDSHLYLNSIEATNSLIERGSYNLPQLELNKDIKNIYDFRESDIKIIGYQAHPNIKVDVAI